MGKICHWNFGKLQAVHAHRNRNKDASSSIERYLAKVAFATISKVKSQLTRSSVPGLRHLSWAYCSSSRNTIIPSQSGREKSLAWADSRTIAERSPSKDCSDHRNPNQSRSYEDSTEIYAVHTSDVCKNSSRSSTINSDEKAKVETYPVRRKYLRRII